MKLYEISDKIEAVLIAGTDTETGEITDEALAALDDLEGELEQKALNVGCYIKGEEAEAEAVMAEAKRLQARAQIHKRRAERLLKYLASHVEGQSFKDARCQIGWRKSKAVEVEDVAKLPEEYVRTKLTLEPDKTTLRKILSAGIEVDGAELVERWSLQVR